MEAVGIDVFRTCATGNEVIRAFNIYEDGVLIYGVRFLDRTADQLAWDLSSRVLMLTVGKALQLEKCEHPYI